MTKNEVNCNEIDELIYILFIYYSHRKYFS